MFYVEGHLHIHSDGFKTHRYMETCTPLQHLHYNYTFVKFFKNYVKKSCCNRHWRANPAW